MMNFSDYAKEAAEREAESGTREKINYFSMKDGDKKTMVINFDPNTEPMHFVHNYFSNSDSRYTKIKCLGSGCPLCARARSFGKNESNYFKSYSSPRVFLQLFDEEGVEYVWERPFKFVQASIVPLIEDLGDLGKVFVTITRTGTRTDTKYSILPALDKGSVKRVPKELDDIIKDSTRIEAPRKMFLDLDIDMIEEFLETGKVNFSRKSQDNESPKKEITPLTEEDEDVPF